jgi:phosphate transport system protein
MSHFEERLEKDLNLIRDRVWELGNDVEHALRNSKQALLTRDSKLAYATVLGDNPINRESRACDRECHRFIARYLPGAGHLREMAATIRVNVALERIGDYAVTICRESMQLKKDLPKKFLVQMDLIADESFQILSESRKAFREGNAESATTLMKMVSQVEGQMDMIYDQLLSDDSDRRARVTMTVFVVFSLLKRVADQAKNICDQTVYSVRGVAKIPKVYKFLFVDKPGSGASQLGMAIGQKNYPTSAVFRAASSEGGQELPSSLAAFLEERALPNKDLDVESLEALAHDLSDFHVVISLGGDLAKFIKRLPFHTSALEWELDTESEDWNSLYRDLHSRITDLMDLVAGDEAA